MIEYLIDFATPAGSTLAIYILLDKKIDKLLQCINQKHLTNSKEIANIKGRLGLG